MARVRIRGEHLSSTTGQIYRYMAAFHGHGPDLIFKGEIPIPARKKILHVERVLTIDPATETAVDAVHAAMHKVIDETDFATVDCD
jgi:hypothetical protein